MDRDLVEILDHAASPEELLEHTRMAMYQDRIFAFTPKGELIQLPKGATPVDFAYAVHTDLGDRTVGAKINGRVVPLRTSCRTATRSRSSYPSAAPAAFMAPLRRHRQGARGVRRFVRHKERDETVALGRKIYDEIVERLPAVLDKDALKQALKRLKLESQDELMIAIARKRVSDEQVMEALMPGSAGGDVAPRPAGQRTAISIKGLTPGVAFISPNAATRFRATASSASAARTKKSRSTSSAATRWQAESTRIGSTLPGARVRTAARRGSP